MTEERPLAAGLVARRSINRLEIVLPAGAPELVFTRLAGPTGRGGVSPHHPSAGRAGAPDAAPAAAGAARAGHIAAGLAFAGGKMCVDVTIQPGALVRQLDLTAAEQAVDATRWRRAVLAELADWSGQLGWCPAEPDRLTAAIGALGHPLLHHVYERGHRALDEVPRWAVPVLRAPDAMAAARTLDPAATRRVARALAASLLARGESGQVELAPLAYATIAGGLVSADELANLLERPCPERPHPLPTGEQITEARRSLELWPASRRATLLLAAAGTVGPVEMAAVMRKVWWIRHRVPRALPVNWAELTRLCLELVPMVYDDEPTATTASTGIVALDELLAGPTLVVPAQPLPAEPATRTPARTPQRRTPARTPQRRTPARPRDVETARPALNVPNAPDVDLLTRWSVPRGLAPVQGLQCGPVELEVPTSVAQLRHWGELLHNCLGTYGSVVVAGRSWLIGIRLGEALVGCVEIETRRRTVRQILGARNEALPAELRDPVLDTLHRLGVVADPVR